MAFNFRGRKLETVGVVGSGQIGPDIALYFAKVLSPDDCKVVVVDISQPALDKGQARVHRKVDKGIASGAFSPEQGQKMKDSVVFSNDYGKLAGAGLIVEAATEDKNIKAKIFASLEEICAEDAILASNSSHLEPEVIGSSLKDRSRSCVIHYFFPAERNPVVEVVPGAETDRETTDWLMAFYERIGKAPLCVRSRYGYALDPIFEGIFQAAALCVEAGMGTTKEVDAVATRALGQTVGPFTAMNLTGGNPITAVGLDQYTTKIMPWFKTPQIMKDALAAGTPWDVPARKEKVELPAERETPIREALQGAYLGIADEILSAGLISLADLEMGCAVALDMTAPAALANQLGLKTAVGLINSYAESHDGFPPAKFFSDAAQAGESIEVPVVLREDHDGVAILKVRRPKSLNSLDEHAFAQIGEHIEAINRDDAIQAAVLTGFGHKAFVSGADVRFLARIDSPETGMRDARDAQAVGDIIQGSKKPVVCAMNGVAFGGGMEMALCCTARVVREDLPVLGAQPEVKLGIIPGAGGTQRLPRLLGVEKAAQYLRTGRAFSATEAVEMGLASEAVSFDELIPRAIEFAQELAAGKRSVPPMERGPLKDVPESLGEIDLGHLSTKIDEILCRAILEGARTTLAEGLRIENACFGEVCRTKDMRIGLDTFLTKGPRAKAEFINA